MSDTRKKEIIMATLELRANKGRGNVSIKIMADEDGVKIASLYMWFAYKVDCGEGMY